MYWMHILISFSAIYVRIEHSITVLVVNIYPGVAVVAVKIYIPLINIGQLISRVFSGYLIGQLI